MFLHLGMADLAVGLGVFGAAGAAGAVVSLNLGLTQGTWVLPISFAIGVPAYLVIAPIVHRAAGLRPMHYPPCPHCGAPDGPWGYTPGTRPKRQEAMICGRCGAPASFVYRRGTDVEATPGLPAFLLRWPRPFGIWKRIR